MPVKATYHTERVVLSGGKFQECVFTNCELVFDGTPADITDCKINGCKWSFHGPAAKTLELVAALCKSDPSLALTLGRQLGIVDLKETTH